MEQSVSVPGSEDNLSLKFTLGDVLKFVTGALVTPPLGFSPSPSINFHETSKFPMANTCSNTLTCLFRLSVVMSLITILSRGSLIQ